MFRVVSNNSPEVGNKSTVLKMPWYLGPSILSSLSHIRAFYTPEDKRGGADVERLRARVSATFCQTD